MRLISLAQDIVNRIIAPLDIRVVRRTAMGNDLIANVRRLLGGPPSLIFDVGANVGQTFASFRAAWPAAKIVCFEPSPQTFRRLSARTDMDPLAEAHRLALSDVDGELSFREFSESTANSLLEPTFDEASPEWVKRSTVTQVQSRTLDGWCADSGYSAIDLLKIDTQGADRRVLAGAPKLLASGVVRLVYFEVLFASHYKGQGDFAACHTLLAEHGYRFVDFYEKVRDLDHAITYCNALYGYIPTP